MGVRVAGEQGPLEEEHAQDPDGRGPAEARQDHLGHHRLDAEQKRRADEERDREAGHEDRLGGAFDRAQREDDDGGRHAEAHRRARRSEPWVDVQGCAPGAVEALVEMVGQV